MLQQKVILVDAAQKPANQELMTQQAVNVCVKSGLSNKLIQPAR